MSRTYGKTCLAGVGAVCVRGVGSSTGEVPNGFISPCSIGLDLISSSSDANDEY